MVMANGKWALRTGWAIVLPAFLAESWHCQNAGGRKKISLPDGTEVTIKAKTSVRLSERFGKKDREVWLDGEALFEVAPDPAKPFLVHTKYLRIDVLGTRFRVDAYPDKAGEEVDLLSGSLKVSKSYHSESDNEPELLHAGEMLMINRDIDLMEKEKMDGTEMKEWDAGK
ncbi:MAG: FecR family protein [Bacteroidota bacterium]|nr:FecR family protein [Bacteroidota bacterium]